MAEQQNVIQHESGLRFIEPEYPFARNSGNDMSCWGARLNNPQFIDVEGLGKRMNELDSVEERSVYIQGKNPHIGVEGSAIDPKHKAIVSTKSGKLYSIVKKDWQPINDIEMVKPLYDLALERKLKPVGRFDEVGTGSTRGHVVLANPDFTVQLLKEHDDPIMLGVSIQNSYNTDFTCGAEIFGIRMVCSNYCLWGALLGKIRFSHKKEIDGIVESYTELVENLLDGIPTLSDKVQAAMNVVIAESNVEDLLWGLSFPKRGIDEIAADVSAFEPMVKTVGLNAWTLYNASTAWLSYRAKGSERLSSTTYYTRKATDLLTVGYDALLDRGIEAHKKYTEALEQQRKEAQLLKEAMIAKKVA